MNEVNEVTPPEGAAPTPAIDPSAIAAEVVKQQQAATPQPRMTQDELQEFLQVWQPDENFADAFQTVVTSEDATPADRVQALNTIRDGIVGQATRGAELLVEEKLAEMEKKFGSANQYAQQAQAEAMWKDFTDSYPTLKEHQEVVDMVSTNLMSSGFKPSSKEELYEKVAAGTAGMIQKFDSNFQLAQQGQQQQQPSPTQGMPEMAAMGGAPPGGPGVGPTKNDNSVASIWD